MHLLSEKAQQLTPYVAGLQPQERGWIKLNTNENPYPTSEKVTEALAAVNLADLRLYPDGDSTLLRAAISNVLNVPRENIFCGNSSDEVLALAFQAFFSGKARVLSPDISYGFYPVWAQMYDVGMEFVPVGEDFTVDADAYHGGNGVVIANPNAPTSLAISLEDVEKIMAANENSVVIIDEAYIDFARVQSAVSLVEKYENLLVVRTFSKAHSLAGLRVGYAIGSEGLIDGLRRVRDAFNSYPLGLLAQTAAAAAISDVAHLKATTSDIVVTRDIAMGAIRLNNINVLESQANFIFMEVSDAPALYEHLLDNKILVRHWNKPRLENFLRVSVGTKEDMNAFHECLVKYLNV